MLYKYRKQQVQDFHDCRNNHEIQTACSTSVSRAVQLDALTNDKSFCLSPPPLVPFGIKHHKPARLLNISMPGEVCLHNFTGFSVFCTFLGPVSQRHLKAELILEDVFVNKKALGCLNVVQTLKMVRFYKQSTSNTMQLCV